MRIVVDNSDGMVDLPYESACIHTEPFNPSSGEEGSFIRAFANVDSYDYLIGAYREERWKEIHRALRKAMSSGASYFVVPQN